MEQEEKREFSETVNNEVPEGAEYDVFECNVKTFLESHEMNRDYLKHIYKEDMSFLNKDVRMTRTEYYKELNDIENTYAKELSVQKKLIVLHAVLFVLMLIFAIIMLSFWLVNNEVYGQLRKQASLNDADFSASDSLGYWAMITLYGSLGFFSLFFGIVQFAFFGYGHYKKIKGLKKSKEKSISLLNDRKHDFMLLGQYDAAK